MLHEKVRMKMELMPGEISDDGYETIVTFKEFDDRYTAPMHGFADAEDYWRKSSCKQFLPGIRVPSLLISAADDPILSEECYPIEEASVNPNFTLEMPDHGGHVGFMRFLHQGEYWSETRVSEFLKE
jgi:predicted alpha/beta-fold hydrolase